MTTRVITFGKPELQVEGRPRSLENRHFALLAYLIVETWGKETHSHDDLRNLLWPGVDKSSTVVSGALTSLREALGSDVGSAVFPQYRRYVGVMTPLSCDATDLLLAQRRRAGRTAALASYRGPFLLGLELGTGEEGYERWHRWLYEQRSRFERIFLDLSRDEAEDLIEGKDWGSAATVVERALRLVPTWSEAQTLLAKVEEKAQQERHAAIDASSGADEPAAEPEPEVEVDTLQDDAADRPTPSDGRSGDKNVEHDDLGDGDGARPASEHHRHWLILILLLLAGILFVLLSNDPPSRDVGNVRANAGGDSLAGGLPIPCSAGAGQAAVVGETFHWGVRVPAGRPFTKRWVLRNTGDCTWTTAFRLHHVSSSTERLSQLVVDLPLPVSIPPGSTHPFDIPMRAPDAPGTYDETWQFRDATDQPVMVDGRDSLPARIIVPEAYYPVCAPGEAVGTLLARKYPDRELVRGDASFRYSWTIKNTGDCRWSEGAILRYVSHTSERLSLDSLVETTRSLEPHEVYTYLVSMHVPSGEGVYGETWTLVDRGRPVLIDGDSIVNIRVRVRAPEVPVASVPICISGESNARFLNENWPDNSKLSPGQLFTKRWIIVNDGNCAWSPDFRLEYVSNSGVQLALSHRDRPLGEIVPPDALYTFEIPMRAPKEPGFYQEDWRFVSAEGEQIMFGGAGFLAALIVVEDPTN